MKLKPIEAELADAEMWRLFPHAFAVVASKGAWLPYKHLVYLAKKLAAAMARGGARVIVEMPPRHGKSELISKWLPAWVLDMRPDARVMLGTYEADFGATWGRKVRDWFESERGQAISGTRIRSDSHAADRWETTAGGGMITAGVGGAFTGRGFDVGIIDDPHKNWQEAQSAGKRQAVIDWFLSTFRTRAEPGAAIIVLQTRWHDRDLAGYLQNEDSDDWEVVRLPAIAEAADPIGRAEGEALCPERYPIEVLQAIKTSLGAVMFAALFQQRPRPLEGGMFAAKDFQRYHLLPATEMYAQSWDLSFDENEGSAFVSGQVWAKHKAGFYLIDEYHEQANFVAQEKAMKAMHERYPSARTVVVENKANGPAIISRLKKDIPGLYSFNPKGSKETRAASISGFVEAGNVHLPAKAKDKPWVEEWLAEVCSFPRGALKDRVDAFVQMLLYWSRKGTAGNIDIGTSTRKSILGGL